tara:strand:+ start:258 stop:545 length:288 start_codon:yes stop_codon:yes gene_type:complete
MAETDKKPASRSGGRSARRALRTAPNFDMMPTLVGNLPFCEVMDGAAVECIDAASKHILEKYWGGIPRPDRTYRLAPGSAVAGSFLCYWNVLLGK